ncbi:uncharacterized protein LOC118191524 [Stegodyphus dumicola]|uniref:uncharacterized protein LOC118191524 n=1 Tax=Stegodyphus dumicola TaxID=202533 RepID=UPI0015B3237F|nr:uncharacterized protein LOC118191524 [Stegodyphus dumicola]
MFCARIISCFLPVLLCIAEAHSTNSLYLELKILRGTCYPHDTCSEFRTEEEDNLWGTNTCECGQHCVRYGTCCIDSPYLFQKQTISFNIRERCQRISTSRFSVLLVANCSNRWRHRDVIHHKCENLETVYRDPLSIVPVTSTSTGTVYKNYFCALCNYDSENIIIWNIVLHKDGRINWIEDCQQNVNISNFDANEFLNNLIFDATENSWGILEINPCTKDKTFQKIELKFHIPSVLQNIVKKCYPDLISQCNSLQKNHMYAQKCHLYYSPITLRVNGRLRKYRNIHCALCNNVSVDQDMDVCIRESDNRRLGSRRSFIFLLDINEKEPKENGSSRKCQEGQLYDTFFKKCRSLKCILPGYIIKNGSCVHP